MKWSFALSIFAFACGGDGVRHLPDAPPSPTDALSADAGPPPPVTVTVTYGGMPQLGITAIFTNADSSPVATLQTDANGTASQAMAAGGFVTVVDPFPIEAEFSPDVGPSNLFTWAGVKPGDHLQLGNAIAPETQLSFTLVTPVVANATSYQVTTTCGGFIAGGSLAPPDGSDTLLPRGSVSTAACTTTDVFVAAYASATLLATLYHPALTFTPAQTVDLSATDHFAQATAATYSYSNLPSTTVADQFELVSSNLVIEVYDNSSVSSGSATLTGEQPAVGTLTSIVDTSFPTAGNTHDVVDWGVPNGNYTLDLGGQALPDVTDTPAFDYAADTLTWTASGGAAPDFVEASLGFTGDPAVTSWQVVAPYSAGTLQLPLLAGYMPAAGDTLDINALETAQVPGGYDAVRAYALSPVGTYWFSAAAANGRALVQNFIGQEGQSVVH